MRALQIFMFLASANLGFCKDCRDAFSKTFCNGKKKLNSCHLEYVKNGCEKTCGKCIPGPSPTCGTVAIPATRVVEGTTAKPGAWPWQVGIRFRGRYHCGGALVSPAWVLSAARCVQKSKWPGNYTAVVGATNMMVVEASWQKRKIVRLVSHPHNRLLYNDLVLLKMDKPVLLNNYVRTICLPSPFMSVAAGNKCYLTGWGQVTSDGKPYLQLQQSALPVISNDQCRTKNQNKTPILITSRMLCAGKPIGHTQAGCHGDNGSPFACLSKDSNKFVLHGIASWGSASCDATDVYTVFSRISKFRRWIDSVVTSE